jgi:hypothetical protein
MLQAVGATSYLWSNGAGGAVVAVSPSVSTCYTVTGTNSGGCGNSAVVCVTVIPSPNITATGSGTVCHGSSITFTAMGGNTYSWSTGATTATMNVIPNVSTSYFVTGTHTLNSCTRTATVTAAVNAGCAIVWPGDANRDGVVTNADVLELGLASNSTGPARTATSIAWAGQLASAWNNTISTGWNRAHADCNGDGTVNTLDNAAIVANFSQTHSFKLGASSGNDISLVPQQNVVYAGQWNVVDIHLGDATNSISQLYGVAFDISYDATLLETGQVNIVYTNSFLKGSIQTIDFGKEIFASGKLYAATVRTDQTNVNGYGKIGELHFKVKQGVPANSSITMSASNAIRVSSSADFNTLSAAAPITMSIVEDAVGLNKVNLDQPFTCFPNPANDKLYLQSGSSAATSYVVSDVNGRELIKGSFEKNATIDISALSRGVYLVKFNGDGGMVVRKITVDR